MTVREAAHLSAGHHAMRLEGEPRLLVLDAAAVAVGDAPDPAVLTKLALLAGSEDGA